LWCMRKTFTAERRAEFATLRRASLRVAVLGPSRKWRDSSGATPAARGPRRGGERGWVGHKRSRFETHQEDRAHDCRAPRATAMGPIDQAALMPITRGAS